MTIATTMTKTLKVIARNANLINGLKVKRLETFPLKSGKCKVTYSYHFNIY